MILAIQIFVGAVLYVVIAVLLTWVLLFLFNFDVAPDVSGDTLRIVAAFWPIGLPLFLAFIIVVGFIGLATEAFEKLPDPFELSTRIEERHRAKRTYKEEYGD